MGRDLNSPLPYCEAKNLTVSVFPSVESVVTIETGHHGKKSHVIGFQVILTVQK